MPTPRDFAFHILRRWIHLHEPPFLPERADPAWAALPPNQRPFAFDLLAGILRWRNTLDAVIASRLSQPVESLEIAVRAALWLGAYQLLFQETADYAAVDTTVSLVRRHAPRAAGLVNAVLRGITRLRPIRMPIDTSLPPEARLSRRRLALDFSTQLAFNADLFPDPATASTAHLAAVRSHPALFVDHLKKLFGISLAAELLLRNNQRPQITLRSDADQLDIPASAGLVAHAAATHFLIAGQGWNPSLESLVKKGTLSPQDPASAKPIRRLADLVQQGSLPAPQAILDLCAGLGTKTLQIARAFPTATITATDIDPKKLTRLAAHMKQVHQSNVQVLDLDQIKNQKSKIKNDLILLDVPCSNTGVFARRVQSRWRWPTLDHAALASLQASLLEQGAALTAPAGTLLYSTCSIDPAENENRIQTFLSTHPHFRLLDQQFTLPSLETPAAPNDGGYFAILALKGSGA